MNAIPKAKLTGTRVKTRALRATFPSVMTTRDINDYERVCQMQAQESFWAYRRYMRPNMKLGWFQKKLAQALQEFYRQLLAGLRPILIIEAPPQHGKSDTITDFIQWLSGKMPSAKMIYASYSDRLGIRANLRLQRAMDGEKYRATFGTRIDQGAGAYVRTQENIEFVGEDGFFRNTTINGMINGEGLDVGLIDDAIKGRAEAQSPSIREKTWAWFTDDFLTRFSEHAGLIFIGTRWHVDDPIGRLKEHFPNAVVLNFKALATEDEYDEDGEPIRKRGEALFPELKSREFLLLRRKAMTTASWESIYQGSPIVGGGDMFPIDLVPAIPQLPANAKVVKRVRYWDKAGTAKENPHGKYTAGVLMAKLDDDRFLIEDVVHDKWKAVDREKRIKQTAIDDGEEVEVWVEQEPGSGGKESAERSVAMLAGYKAYADKVSGDKETRAEPYAAQWQGGNIVMLTSLWNRKFLEEHEYFPNGPFKDQVDAAAGAFAKLTGQGKKKKGGMLW